LRAAAIFQMILRSRTSIAKALRMQAVEIVRIVGIARIAAGIAVAGEGVPVEAVVVAVAGAAVVAVAVEVDVTAVAMADTVATAAAEGTSRGFGIYESQNPTLSHTTRQGWAPGKIELRFRSRLFSFGKIFRR
jgi:hypothetical protein